MTKANNLTGERFGRLVVLSRDTSNTARNVYWICKCECGTIKSVCGVNLRNQHVKSCGCLRREVLKDRQTKPDEDITYSAAHKRINKYRGAASEYRCIDCGEKAEDWSLVHSARAKDLTAIHGGYTLYYSGSQEDYEPRCRACHKKYDDEVSTEND